MPTLHCKQTHTSLKNYNSSLGLWSPRRYLFSDLSEIATLVWVATHTLGSIAYFTSRCKAHCADESCGTHWDGQKNEVITFSQDAEINAAGSTFSGELQTALLNWLCKTKKKVVVSLHNFPCILISRSLPNFKEIYPTWQLSDINLSTTPPHSPKQVKWRQMAATLHTYGWLLHHAVGLYTFKMMYFKMHAAALQQFWIYDSFDDCWFATHCTISVFKMSNQRISKNCRSTSIFCSSWNLWREPSSYF